MYTINREDLAWAAGLFEGEGSFSTRTGGERLDRSLHAKIKMSDEDVVRRFHAVIGVGNVTGPYESDGAGTKLLWVWQTGSFEGVQHTMTVLWPWLHSRRKEKIKELIALYHKRGNELTRRPPNRDPLKSAQNCGCDEGANHKCEQHTEPECTWGHKEPKVGCVSCVLVFKK